jgi:hypothetical protein
VRQHLTEVLGVEIRTAYMTISEMIGLGFGDTVKIEAVILLRRSVIDPAPASDVR